MEYSNDEHNTLGEEAQDELLRILYTRSSQTYENDAMIRGKYHLIGLIDRGANGNVFEARSLEDDPSRRSLDGPSEKHPGGRSLDNNLKDPDTRSLAIKEVKYSGVLPINLLELHITTSVHHRNILRTLDYFIDISTDETSNSLYLVSLLAERPMKMKLNWMTNLLKGLTTLHTAGFSHNDIKPDNLLLIRKNIHDTTSARIPTRIVLADMGLATIIGTSRITPPTIFYSSPETIHHYHSFNNYDASISYWFEQTWNPCSADLWALGVTIIELLALGTSRPTEYIKFFGESRSQILANMCTYLTNPSSYIRQFIVKYGIIIENRALWIVTRLLHPDASRRYPHIINPLDYIMIRNLIDQEPEVSTICSNLLSRCNMFLQSVNPEMILRACIIISRQLAGTSSYDIPGYELTEDIINVILTELKGRLLY